MGLDYVTEMPDPSLRLSPASVFVLFSSPTAFAYKLFSCSLVGDVVLTEKSRLPPVEHLLGLDLSTIVVRGNSGTQ